MYKSCAQIDQTEYTYYNVYSSRVRGSSLDPSLGLSSQVEVYRPRDFHHPHTHTGSPIVGTLVLRPNIPNLIESRKASNAGAARRSSGWSSRIRGASTLPSGGSTMSLLFRKLFEGGGVKSLDAA